MLTITLIILATILMLPGIALIALMMPGTLYIFAIALIYGIVDHFTHLTMTETAILGGIAILTIIIDQLAGILGAHYGGARGKTFLYGIIGAIAGTILLPPFGGFIGLFAGILIGELIRKQTHQHALKAAAIGVLGTATGIVINIILALVFVALFLIFVL